MTKIGIKHFLERSVEAVQEAPDLRMAQVVGVLQDCVSRFTTRSRHVVFLDGLDAIVSQRDLQFQSLAALMAETDRLNNFFRRNAKPFKFVVLCRTDIFDRLPGANTNKIRQDSGMELDWYDDPRQPQRTRLVRLVNLRARHSLRRDFDVFDEYFPSRINDQAIRPYLLNHTRHTPRDILQLMRRIQAHADGSGKLGPLQVKSGVRDYSQNYFISEVRNELAGYVGNDEIEQAVTLLTTLDEPEFRLHELRGKAETLEYKTLDVNALASALFNCSAIGMVGLSTGKRPQFTFKFRNRTATLVPDSKLVIHPGALSGLNIEESRRANRGSRGAKRAVSGSGKSGAREPSSGGVSRDKPPEQNQSSIRARGSGRSRAKRRKG